MKIYGKKLIAALLAAGVVCAAAPSALAAAELGAVQVVRTVLGMVIASQTAPEEGPDWPDGVYEPEAFRFSGGSGRVAISCPQVEVRRGQAWAEIVFSSKNYPYIKVDGVEYDTVHEGDTSSAVIPVKLNEEMTILGMTTAMSSPHEIEYTLFIYLPTAVEREVSAEYRIPGLRYLSTDGPYADGAFTLSRYDSGAALITLTGAGRYLLLSPEEEIPAGLPEDIRVLRRGAENVYVASRTLYDALKSAGLADSVTLAGFENADGLTFAGYGEMMEAAQLLRSRCGLAILPWSFAEILAGASEDGDSNGAAAAQLRKVADALGELHVPVFPDGSENADADWMEDWLALYRQILCPEGEEGDEA